MIVVPYQSLSVEALHGVIEAFVLREGTDYGHVEYTLEDKVQRVLKQLQTGRAEIRYYPDTEHMDIALLEA